MTLEMAWRTRPLQLVLSGGPVTPNPTIEYNGLIGENRGPFRGQQPSASNPVVRKVVTKLDYFTAHDAAWHREQDSLRPQPCCYSSYSRLFHAPWSDPSACRTDDMPWSMLLVIYKQTNTIKSNHFFLITIFQCSGLPVCSDVLFAQTQRNFFMQILFHIKIITLLGTHSFLLEGSTLVRIW